VRKERQKQSIAEIDTIMAAIESRDIAAAKAAAEHHVLNSAVSALPFAETKPAPRRTGQLVGDLQG
jgi:DNA-binding GntR family transcriptional regulator